MSRRDNGNHLPADSLEARASADLNQPTVCPASGASDDTATVSGSGDRIGRVPAVASSSRTTLNLVFGLLWIWVQVDCLPGESTIQTGDSFPNLSKFSLEGTLPETLKGKVIVVDFWASWCGPCKESFSVLEELHRRFDKRDLVILAVNVDESRGAMEEFLKEHPVTFMVVRDSKKALARALNFQSMPTSFILDADGRVHSIYHGFHTAETRRSYIREIKQLLKLDPSDCAPTAP